MDAGRIKAILSSFRIMSLPVTIDLNPKEQAQGSIIWLHGLGAEGTDFVPMVDRLNLPKNHRFRFVFPHAPIRSITINSGMKMRAWYDIAEVNLSLKEDSAGFSASSELVDLLIAREEDFGIPANKIILGGFSQGAALSMHAGLRYPKRLAGIIALSGYLPFVQDFEKERNLINQDLPIFMAHGTFDPIVPFLLGEKSKAVLEKLNYHVEWHSYPMAHTVIPEEMLAIGNFIQATIK